MTSGSSSVDHSTLLSRVLRSLCEPGRSQFDLQSAMLALSVPYLENRRVGF